MTGDNIGEEEPFIQDNLTEIEDDKLYRVVSGLYSAQMLGAVEDQSKGILKLSPKNEKGEVITDFEEYIIYDQKGQELKEWYALAGYLESFEKDEEGVSRIPERYRGAEGRKVIQDSANPVELLKNPNRFAVTVYSIALLLIFFLVITGLYAVGKYKQRRRNEE